MTIAFGLLVLSIMPAMLGSFTPTALGQPIPPPDANNQNTTTSTQAAGGEEPRLPTQDGFTIRVLASNFSAPHNILYGPDGALWITERIGKNITRVDPNNGLRLSSMPVPDVYQSAGQDGLLGMAFDPDFNNTQYIYVAYTYANQTGDDVDRRTKITRFTYNPEGQSIGNPMDLISGLSASVDHNSGRMTFGPDGKLYYTIGDQGNNQFTRYCFDIRAQVLPTPEQVEAQDWSVYQGKVA
jgi:PQQ-dependent dehydrogenase (s-GDH family)